MTEPYYRDGLCTIYHGDCIEMLDDLCGQGIDCIATDPPYVFGLASTGSSKPGWGDLMNSARFYIEWLSKCQKILQGCPGSCWVMNSWRSFPVLLRAADRVSWPIASLCVWDKDCIGQGGPSQLRSSYELVALLACKGFKVQDRTVPDVWRFKWGSYRPHGHRAEKPLALFQKIVEHSGGSVFLDPFMGSGTTLEAAKRAGHKAIGIEVDERYCEIAAKRLGQETLDLSA